MPVLESESRNAPRSALRYRPIDIKGDSPVPVATRQRRSRPDTRTTSAPASPDTLDMEEEKQPARVRRAGISAAPQKSVPSVRTRPRFHPLFFVGLGLLLTILLWIGITQLMIWGTNEYNTFVYGYPRTFQMDAVVGHGDSTLHPSHFIAVNLHGTVTIVEFPGGDPSRARELVSTSALGSDVDLAVVTLRFIDFGHNGKPDMLVSIGGVQSVLVNDGKTFRAPTPAEQQSILQELQRSR